MVLEAKKSKIKGVADPVCGESPLLFVLLLSWCGGLKENGPQMQQHC